jgi:hypothetical protein
MKRPVRLCAGLLLTGLTISAIDVAVLWQIWQHLPGVLRARLQPGHYQQAAQKLRDRFSRPARQALAAAQVSSRFTAALRDPASAPEQRSVASSLVSELRDTRLGRLQLAAFRMLELERQASPTEQWWPEIRPFVDGIERGPFNHYLADLVPAQAQIFRELGWDEGAALVEAQQMFEAVHSPLLQFVTGRLYRIADLTTAEESRICRHIADRVLRDWILEPGPLALRLLAADLLARRLEQAGGSEGPSASAELSRRLRQWRAACLSELAAHPVPVPPLGVQRSPDWCPRAYQNLVRQAMLTLCLMGAVAAAAAVGGTMLFLSRRAPTQDGRFARTAIATALWGALVVAAAAWPAFLPAQQTAEEIGRLSTPGLGWPRPPLAAAAATVALLVAPVTWPLHRRLPAGRRLTRLRAAAAWSCIMLALGLGWSARATLSALLAYDRCVAAAVTQTRLPDELCDLLRTWNFQARETNDEDHH